MVFFLTLIFSHLLSVCASSPLSLEEPPLSTPARMFDFPWRCLEGHEPQTSPVTWADCWDLSEEVRKLGPHRYKMRFDTRDRPETDFPVPVVFTVRSCHATIFPIGQRGEPVFDRFTASYLSTSILNMAVRCVRPAPHLGGQGEIGEKKVLGLVVHGP